MKHKPSCDNTPVPVFLFGGEGTGWALDADVETTRQSLLALPDLVRLTSLQEAEIVHSVWDYPLMHMDPASLEKKRIVCHICNDLMRTFEDPCMVAATETIGLWVAISRTAEAEIKRLGLKSAYIPYAVNTNIFTRSFEKVKLQDLKKELGIPDGVFVISNFMRDSSATDLRKPKEQKGVEQFLAIVRILHKKGLPIHLLLAGPRRHWLLDKLREHGVPYSYAGQEMDQDDNTINILAPERINELYHLSDLHLVTSRWEGGPRSVLEAAATMTPIICTPVGMASDVLTKECLIADLDKAIQSIAAMVNGEENAQRLETHYECVMKTHVPEANVPRFAQLYKDIGTVPQFTKKNTRWRRERRACVPCRESWPSKLKSLVARSFKKRRPGDLTIGIWHEYHKPPYGGGNQFMMALKAALERRGVRVLVNSMSSDIDVHICNSAWFDASRFESRSGERPIRMIHRIDGPVTLYRGEGRSEDEKIFALNRSFASATVFQSAFSFFSSGDLGFSAISPTVIHNAVDSAIFNSHGRAKSSRNGKLRLISTAWSDNPRKGGPFYKWLDKVIDFSRFEYTFVGRVQYTFDNIRHIPPQNSHNLANLLREHDIYITASHHEPCSNALLEALACGLPAIYRDDGGNRELVGFGGLPFDGEHDVLGQIDRLADNLDAFRSVIYCKSIDEIAGKYLDLARRVVEYHLP